MQKVSSGMEGLDRILRGGFPAGSSVIVEGAPGTGKSTLCMQFLYEGAKNAGEAGIYVTFEELPEQLYRDMAEFGWDLKELERRNLLRVLCISPGLLMEQMTEPGGLFEQIAAEIGCKRVVIDSISLFKYAAGSEGEHRDVLYRLRGIIRRMGLTALLIREHTGGEAGNSSFESYVFDGVIRLCLKTLMDKFRQRALEILKMRGTGFDEGEHVYRITKEGIHVSAARSMGEDIAVTRSYRYLPTGIGKLDELLSGGISEGSVLMLDTNSKANYKYILGSIVSRRFEEGAPVAAMLSSFNSPEDMTKILSLDGVDVRAAARRGDFYLIEHYNRPIPEELEGKVLQVGALNNDEYRQWKRRELAPIFYNWLQGGRKIFVYYDLNTIVAERGKDYVRNYFSEEAAWARSVGATVLALCNFAEIGQETASYLERTSNGVIRTWVDGSYQYIQVTKSSTGRISEPYLVENTKERPFIRMV